ncbi:hypothetical protein CN070_16200 [Sinorhizobium meliloti]|nr:hypothetical protein CN070_16200 [Sinorhizobium meliloti]
MMNVIDSNKLERDAGGKPHTLFLIPLQVRAGCGRKIAYTFPHPALNQINHRTRTAASTFGARDVNLAANG